MEIEINMINVEDGDAIILTLKDQATSEVVVIDGGKKYFNERVKPRLDAILKENNKTGPDLLICTHMDSDHIKGCISIVSAYGNNIKELWAFGPNQYIDENFGEYSNILFEQNHRYYVSGFFYHATLATEMLLERAKELYESYAQLNQLFGLLRHIDFDKQKIKDPVRGTQFKNYPFHVLSPTHDFFRKYINDKGNAFQNLTAMAKAWNVNRASVVCKLANGDKGYLFTGDADKTTLKEIPQNEISNLHFLDVPHHGSIANIDKSLISLMKPKISFISAAGYVHHPNPEVVELLKKHGQVEITNTPTTTQYLLLNKDSEIKRI